MPQMNPTWWLTLFILFIMIFMMTNPLIYFSKNISISNNARHLKKFTSKNWKW